MLASACSSYRRRRGSYGAFRSLWIECGPRLFHFSLFGDTHITEAGVRSRLLMAFGHAAPLGHGFLHVGVLTSTDADARLRPRLAPGPPLLFYEPAQFLDEIKKMSQAPLHSLLRPWCRALSSRLFQGEYKTVRGAIEWPKTTSVEA